jgi:amidohydrolase
VLAEPWSMSADQLKERIKEIAARIFPELVSIRRHFHRYPELSFQEKETAGYIADRLTHLNIPHQSGIAGYGIKATIEGLAGEGACVGLRADMDALPIHETATHDYVSRHHGVMHACGHDAHMAILLGAAEILQEIRDHFTGKIVLIFQPAEEKLPGGAKKMIEAGVLKQPSIEAIYALHVSPDIECGKAGFKEGAFMASGDEINITVKGKGGHAAMPHLIQDNVLIAAQLLVHLQTVSSRLAPATIPTVLSFGRIMADGAHNIIPDQVLMQGTFRTFDETWRNKAKEHIRNIAVQTAAAMGASAEVVIDEGYPVLMNDPQTTRVAAEAMRCFLGQQAVAELPQRMTTEDFARFSHVVPSCLIRLGTANPAKSQPTGLHTAGFDIDERALEFGAGLMAFIAISRLKNEI